MVFISAETMLKYIHYVLSITLGVEEDIKRKRVNVRLLFVPSSKRKTGMELGILAGISFSFSLKI